MSALFLELARTVLFVSSSPHMFKLRMIFSMVTFALHGEMAKTLPVVRLVTQAYCVYWCCCWGWTSCHNPCRQTHGICKDLKALSQTLQGWTLSLSCVLSPHTDPIQQQQDFPHKPALHTCRARCQQISTPLHVLLKADPHLEGDVADDKADPSVCLQFSQISVVLYF